MIQQLSVIVSAAQAEFLADILFENGALSVSMEDAADTPLYQTNIDEQLLWPSVNIKALFDVSVSKKNINILINFVLANTDLIINWNEITKTNWVEETQRSFPPLCFGEKLWIYPGWVKQKDFPAHTVFINPGLAFGTGTHPTTALCLEWLVKHSPRNQMVMDYGCGSGILGLASLSLGASKVIAVDHDPQALESTRANLALNPAFIEKMFIQHSDAVSTSEVDLILANILAKPIIELAPTFNNYLQNNGTLVLSGFLEKDIPNILSAYPNYKLKNKQINNEWCLLELSR